MADNEWEPTPRAKRWKDLYDVQSPADQVKNTYKISKEFQEKSCKYATSRAFQTLLVTELRYAVGGDVSTTRKVQRLHAIPPKLIEEAVRFLKQQESRRKAVSPLNNSRKSPRGDRYIRASRAQGFSRSHLLCLVRIRKRRKVTSVFYQCKREYWSLVRLQREIRRLNQSTEQIGGVRPSNLARMVSVDADRLAERLMVVIDSKLGLRSDLVKAHDYSFAIDQCVAAIKSLAAVTDHTKNASAQLEQLCKNLQRAKG